MSQTEETFWKFLWRITKSPRQYFNDSPLAQSAAAVGVNVWFLVIAVLAQFWVFLSFFLLLAQFYNTWLVYHGRITIPKAVLIGMVLVIVNLAALLLAVLGQFWVIGSCVLSLWQLWSLGRVCVSRKS